jgi:hypothetical protein
MKLQALVYPTVHCKQTSICVSHGGIFEEYRYNNMLTRLPNLVGSQSRYLYDFRNIMLLICILFIMNIIKPVTNHCQTYQNLLFSDHSR